ncbi:MAG: hypothetical protein IKG84_00020 [Bacteroidales bacterium]|nr:hypothetical protein [Bacteroidales bacterium]
MRKNSIIPKITAWAAGLMALTQCASIQEIEAPATPEGNFEVFAAPEDTRTVNEGQSTRWVAGDRFNLFHAAAGAASYVSDGAFTVDNVQTGHATGTVKSLGGKAYDWYMVYPYSESATTPKAAPVTIGAATGKSQVQAGADSRAHLAGTAVPLSGRVKAVAADETPVLSVAPAVSVIAVNVTNPGEADVRITDISFRAQEAIVGTFQVDVTGDSPVFTPVSASEEATLTVQGGALLKKEESAVFYLVIKPFFAAAGSALALTVNDEMHSVTLTRPVSFSAGKIKTLNVTLDPSEPQPQGTYYFKRVSSFTPGKKYIMVAEETDSEENVQLRMAKAIPEGSDKGRMECEDVEEENGIITLSSQENAFTFYEGEDGTLIRQADGRYLYNKNSSSDSNVYVGTEPSVAYYWTISFDNQGQASIVNRQRQLKYNNTSTVRAFQARKTTESGLPVLLYELQNSDDAVEEFLRNTTPGVYAYEGSDWLYEEGTMQLSVRTGNDAIAFRIYDPATYTVIQVTGIPETIAENDRLDIRVARYVKQAATHFSNLSVQVVRVADGKAWLMAGNGTGIIVCIQ